VTDVHEPSPDQVPHEPMSTSDCQRSEHDCDEAVAQLYAFLDGELDDATVVKVEAHLQHCSPCLEAFDFEAELRKVIVAKCHEDVPGDLRARIMTVLERLEETSGPPA
jgi:mycothiol system anti-sigma-R factor